jgi:hypothetical protein
LEPQKVSLRCAHSVSSVGAKPFAPPPPLYIYIYIIIIIMSKAIKPCSKCKATFNTVGQRIHHYAVCKRQRKYTPRPKKLVSVCPHCNGTWATKNIGRHIQRCSNPIRSTKRGQWKRRVPPYVGGEDSVRPMNFESSQISVDDSASLDT